MNKQFYQSNIVTIEIQIKTAIIYPLLTLGLQDYKKIMQSIGKGMEKPKLLYIHCRVL